jgi:hypothetical protein
MEHMRKRGRAVLQTNVLKAEMRLILAVPREARAALGRGESLWQGNDFIEQTMLITTISLGAEYSKIDRVALAPELGNRSVERLP